MGDVLGVLLLFNGQRNVMSPRVEHERPRLRGYLHLAAAALVPLGLLALLLQAHSPASYVGAAIFGTGLLGLFAVSGSYQAIAARTRFRALFQRLDHGMIFFAVAASYSPFCLQVMGWAAGIPLLAIVWTLALAGAALKQFWISAPTWLAVTAYALLGWIGVVALPWLAANLNAVPLGAVFLAGTLFTVGGALFALGRPNPIPRIFGHHEVFHVFVTAGFGLIYAVVFTSGLPR